MTLNTAKKILKYFGIINIVLALITLGLGIAGLAASGSATAAEAGVDANKLSGAGMVLLIAGALGCVDGILCVLASKNSKYGLAALIFSIFNMINAVYSIIADLYKGTSILDPIISLVIALALCYAANMVRVDYNKTKN